VKEGMYKMSYIYKTQSSIKSNAISEKMLLSAYSGIAREVLAYKIYSDLIEASIINTLVKNMIDVLVIGEEKGNG